MSDALGYSGLHLLLINVSESAATPCDMGYLELATCRSGAAQVDASIRLASITAHRCVRNQVSGSRLPGGASLRAGNVIADVVLVIRSWYI